MAEGSTAFAKATSHGLNSVDLPSIFVILDLLLCVGGGERPSAGYPLHLQRAAGLPHLLAHLRHHGGPALCREILQGSREYLTAFCKFNIHIIL